MTKGLIKNDLERHFRYNLYVRYKESITFVLPYFRMRGSLLLLYEERRLHRSTTMLIPILLLSLVLGVRLANGEYK